METIRDLMLSLPKEVHICYKTFRVKTITMGVGICLPPFFMLFQLLLSTGRNACFDDKGISLGLTSEFGQLHNESRL